MLAVPILSTFALVWLVLGSRSVGSSVRRAMIAIGSISSIALVACALLIEPSAAPAGAEPQWSWYLAACAFEAVLIPAAVLALKRKRPRLLLPVIAAIVGAHFFGLVPAFGSWVYGMTGAALIVVSAVAVFALPERLARSEPPGRDVYPRDVLAGIGAAVILWSTCAWLAVAG
jgi:hypothetical protein